jgi:bifunctional non-homologous end joining protein LigD
VGIDLEPMLCTLGSLPADESRWAFEPKWDGFRALVHSDGDRVRVFSRRGTDLTGRCPELAPLARALRRPCVLDGELVILDAEGRPDFEAMRRRGLLGQVEAPLVFVAFDVLSLDRALVTDRPWKTRRSFLMRLGVEGPGWTTTPAYVGEGRSLFEATREQGLEGVVAKRLDAPYRPGTRSRAWVKCKHMRTANFVVGGFAVAEPERGRRAALLVGSWEPDGTLRCAGRVEAGFPAGGLETVRAVLRSTPISPFGMRFPYPVEHCEPELEVAVQFLDRSDQGWLRHTSFKGVAPASVWSPGGRT